MSSFQWVEKGYREVMGSEGSIGVRWGRGCDKAILSCGNCLSKWVERVTCKSNSPGIHETAARDVARKAG